jgi:hypothetical protein
MISEFVVRGHDALSDTHAEDEAAKCGRLCGLAQMPAVLRPSEESGAPTTGIAGGTTGPADRAADDRARATKHIRRQATREMEIVMYRRGQKVVCINSDWRIDRANHNRLLERDPTAVLPRLNGIYTIKNIIDRADCFTFYEPMKYLEWRDDQIKFARGSFRPLVDRPTDISLLTRLLVPGAKILVNAC